MNASAYFCHRVRSGRGEPLPAKLFPPGGNSGWCPFCVVAASAGLKSGLTSANSLSVHPVFIHHPPTRPSHSLGSVTKRRCGSTSVYDGLGVRGWLPYIPNLLKLARVVGMHVTYHHLSCLFAIHRITQKHQ